jgi:hypothetical protein
LAVLLLFPQKDERRSLKCLSFLLFKLGSKALQTQKMNFLKSSSELHKIAISHEWSSLLDLLELIGWKLTCRLRISKYQRLGL